MDTRTPRWTSGTFLLYTGGLTVLLVALASLAYLSDGYDGAAYAGWALLVLAALTAIARGFRRSGRWVAGGVFALAAVVAVAAFVGAVESWWGWLPDDRSGAFRGFDVPVLLLELLTLLAALVALAAHRFPLLVAAVAGVAWFFVTDLISGGGDWSAVVTFLVGLGFLLVATGLDRGRGTRPYAFWLHVAAGLTIGGSLLFFWHRTDANWALVAVASLVFVGIASGLGRSSWAVLGAVGLFLSGAHFAAEWSRPAAVVAPLLGGSSGGGARTWAALLVFAFVGFLLVALGLHVARRREPASSG